MQCLSVLVTQLNSLLQQHKHLPLCLSTPVALFFSATFLLFYICPCPFTPSPICFISIFSSHISFLFCFFYLTHPLPCPVSLHSFPVIAFCLAPSNLAPKGLFINIYLTFWLRDNQEGICGVWGASGVSLVACPDSVNVAGNQFAWVAFTASLHEIESLCLMLRSDPKNRPLPRPLTPFFGSYLALEPKIRVAPSSSKVWAIWTVTTQTFTPPSKGKASTFGPCKF